MGKNKNRTDKSNADTVFGEFRDDELKEKKRRIRKEKNVDFLSKIICVLIAAVIWFYVMQVDSPQYEDTFKDVEIKLSGSEVLEKERGLSVYSGYGRTVDITVSGKKSVVGRYTADDIRVTADISGITAAGNYEVEINVSLPDGLDLVETEYESIHVYADERASATVLLKAKITGFTQSVEFEYGEPTLEFDSVVVTGPKMEVDDIDYAVVNVDFSAMGVISQTTSATRSISLVGKDGENVDNPYIKLSRTEALVTVPVYTEKLVPLRVDWFYGYINESNAEVTITPSEVRVKGDPTVLGNMQYITIAAIDEKSLEGNIIKNYTVESGNDYTVVGDSEARLSVKHVGTETRTYRVTNFRVESGDNRAEVLEGYKTVTLRGAPDVLDSITEKDIYINADVSGYDSGYTGNVLTEAVISIAGIQDGSVYEIGFYSLKVKVN